MTNYLGHEFESGKCIHCGAVEKSARQFQAFCTKADQPASAKSLTEAAAAPKGEKENIAVPVAIELNEARSAPRQLETGISSQIFRYRDAYLVANATAAIGGVVKGVGIALGGLIIVVAVVVGGQNGSTGLYFTVGLLLGAIAAIPIYIMGVLVSAQAQILRAILDTAVHSSPFLTKEDKLRAMSH